ncbi:Na/Pi cotransporter family protein [Devosia sp. ZW T5_3]|uniref:Na/Pi cotransporter family protein n=1 Tax=Devosia sp. ZW T5_3 TaxID=3378085 RepID=UPI0038537750
MSSTIHLIDLLGAGALLIWGLRLIKTGIMNAFGGSLRQWIGKGTGNRFKAALSGLLATLALQSSTATAVITASFASRGIIEQRMAQAVMLGANVGTAIAAVILSMDVHWIGSAMILIGVVTYSVSQYARGKGVGRAALGLGLMLLALQLLGQVTEPLRESEMVIAVLSGLGDAPVIALLLATGLAFVASSSLAVVLFVALLAQSGLVTPTLAVILVAGANLGGAIPPWLAVSREGVEARRLTLSNLVVRGLGALVLTAFAGPVAAFALPLLPNAHMLTIATHIGFSLVLLVVFLPLLDPIAALATKLVPARAAGKQGPTYLDDGALDTPAIALAVAARETLRVGDLVGKMLEISLNGLMQNDPALRDKLGGFDDDVDALQEAIKLYLAKLGRGELDPDDDRRAAEIVSYAINLEHIGDIIDRGLCEQATKKTQRKLKFSPEGLAEIQEMYAKTIENLRLSQSVFFGRDPELARALMAGKVEIRRLEAASSERHLKRVRALRSETLETSTLHLDILRDLKRINAHLASVAVPILEQMGELSESRLVHQASAAPALEQK